MTMPGVAAGALMVFMLSVGFYITPALVGGPDDQMVSYFIAFFTNQTINWGMAAALACLLLAMTALIVVVARLVVPGFRARRGATCDPGARTHRRIVLVVPDCAHRRGLPAVVLLGRAPHAAHARLVAALVRRLLQQQQVAPRHAQQLRRGHRHSDPRHGPRHAVRARHLPRPLPRQGGARGAAVHADGGAGDGDGRRDLLRRSRSSASTTRSPGLVLAHTVLSVPYVLITVLATLQTFDRNLLKAAATCGAPPHVAFRRVVLPLIAPGVATGALFAFATSFDELVVAIFVAEPGSSSRCRARCSRACANS